MRMKKALVFSLCGLGALLLSAGAAPASPPRDLSWKKSTPLPEPRAGYAAGVLDGKLVIAGGTFWEGKKGNWTQKIFSARTHAFDPATEKWEQLPDAPIPFGYAACTVVDNRLYVLGGYDGEKESLKILTLELQGSSYVWKIFGELPETRLFGWAFGVGSSIYLLGGVVKFEPMDEIGTCCTSRTATNQLQVLDTTNPEKGWRELSPYPGGKRWLFSAETDGESLWMFGGIYSANASDPATKFRQVLRYSFQKDAWEKLSPLPQETLTAAPLFPLHADGKILLMSFSRTVWQLDLKTQKYSKLAPLPEEAFVDKYVWIKDQIIGAGGENKIESPRRRSEWTFVGQLRSQ